MKKFRCIIIFLIMAVLFVFFSAEVSANPEQRIGRYNAYFNDAFYAELME